MTGTRVILWGAVAAVAVAVTTAVVAVAATGDRDAGVLSQDDVARELGAATDGPSADGSSAASEPGPDPSPDAAANSEVVSSRAGTLVVTCSTGTAHLQRWSPNPGYRADDVARGPAAAVSVWFESDQHDDVKVIVRCDGDRAVLTEEVEFDDHGGDSSGRG